VKEGKGREGRDGFELNERASEGEGEERTNLHLLGSPDIEIDGFDCSGERERG